jgi:hypothetical protein
MFIAVLLSAALSSCNDPVANNLPDVSPSIMDSKVSKYPSSSVPNEQVTPTVSPNENEQIVPAASEPHLVLNPEDPLANNTLADIQIDYLSERKITPIQADVLDDMPAKTFTSYRKGWALEEVLPVGFHMYIESNRSGSFFYEPVEVFSICEVRPRGIEEEEYAVFDGNGRQITNAVFATSYEGGYVAWLPSGASTRDGESYHIYKDGNISTHIDYNYNFRNTPGWEAYGVPYNSSYYNIFTTPTGKEIICKVENYENEELRYGIISDEILIISRPEYIIAYDTDGKALWKLEFGANEFVPMQMNGMLLAISNSAGKSALYDKNGTRLTEFIYDSTWSYSGYPYVMVEIDEQYGLLDTTGRQVLPCSYRAIVQDPFSSKGVIVCKAGKYGYMEDPSNGKFTLPCEYDGIQFTYGKKEVLVKINGKYYLWKNGILGKVPFEREIYKSSFFDEGIYLMHAVFLESTIVREDGTIIIEDTYLESSEDGYPILFSDSKTGLFGYLNSAAEVIIEPQYELADNFRKGFAIVKKDGYIKLIDKNNNVLLDTIFNDVVCWNPDTLVMAVNYTPGGTKTHPWNHHSAPGSRCGLVKLIMPGTDS